MVDVNDYGLDFDIKNCCLDADELDVVFKYMVMRNPDGIAEILDELSDEELVELISRYCDTLVGCMIRRMFEIYPEADVESQLLTKLRNRFNM